MKKIRILTFWGVPNHGCFLQAYALQKVLQNLYPNYDVKQIPYIKKKHFNFYYGFNFPNRYKSNWLNPYFYFATLRELKNLLKRKKLKSYLMFYEDIPHDKTLTHNFKKIDNCDTLVLGSDIIWDYLGGGNDLADPALFGIGINAKRKISYAPSFCNSSSAKFVPKFVKQALKELNAISVRDSFSANKVFEIIKKKPLVVCDPTFLYDFKSDAKVKVHAEEKPYIAVYGVSFSKEYIDGITKIAQKNNYSIINLEFIGNTFNWADKNIKQKDLPPLEWLGYLLGAEFVMTSTYHGLIFSLQFNKKIIFYPSKFILNKSEDMIDYLGLRDILIENQSFAQKIEYKWDYDNINQKIDTFKNIGINYLLNNC